MAKEKLTASARKGVLNRLFVDMGVYRKRFWGVLVLVAITKLCLAAAPMVASAIMNTIQDAVQGGSLSVGRIVPLCGVLALLYLIGYGADGFVNKALVLISQNIVKKLRVRATDKLNRLPLQYLDRHPIGDTQSRLTVDLLNLSNGVESTASSLIGQAVLMVAIVIMMFVTDWRLALIYVVILPTGMLLMRLITKRTNKLFIENNRELGRMTAHVSDTYSNHLIVKAYERGEEKEAQFDELNRNFEKTYTKSRFLSGFMRPLGNVTAKISYILLCLFSGFLLIRGEMTIGEFTAFLFYGNMIGTPLAELSIALNNFQNALSSAARVYELLDEEEEPEDIATAVIDGEAVRGQVEFDHVAFGYRPEHRLMEDVSFVAKPGQTMAIVGPSGAGKTTLVNLLMRFYGINGGAIRVDGIDTAELSRENLRSVFGMVLQETWIFDGTVAENIAFGKPDATREEIKKAAEMAYCDSFIGRLPNGYDTYLSVENSALSAGEQQLIAIARAVIADPKILILDEATSQVDTKTEEVIARAMENMMKGRTTFMIAHRLHTIRNADQIIYMEQGDIKEVGSHDELLARGGKYARMYESSLSLT